MEGNTEGAGLHSWEMSSGLPLGRSPFAGVGLFLALVGGGCPGMERGVEGLHFGPGPLWSRHDLASRSGREADKEPGGTESNFPLASGLRALCYLPRGNPDRFVSQAPDVSPPGPSLVSSSTPVGS